MWNSDKPLFDASLPDLLVIEGDDRAERERILSEAKRRALRLLTPEDPDHRTWWITREQWQRFRASDNPLEEYRDETEQFVAHKYDDLRGRWFAYSREIGPYKSWEPGARNPYKVDPLAQFGKRVARLWRAVFG